MTAPHEQKLRITGPVVVTANRTGDGAVVYLSAGATWTGDLDAAAVATTAKDASALLKTAAADDRNAIGPYVAPVTLGPDGRARPGNLRERIRLAGPTVALPSEVAILGERHVRL
jgi:uncharacterized protein DUF2849